MITINPFSELSEVSTNYYNSVFCNYNDHPGSSRHIA